MKIVHRAAFVSSRTELAEHLTWCIRCSGSSLCPSPRSSHENQQIFRLYSESSRSEAGNWSRAASLSTNSKHKRWLGILSQVESGWRGSQLRVKHTKDWQLTRKDKCFSLHIISLSHHEEYGWFQKKQTYKSIKLFRCINSDLVFKDWKSRWTELTFWDSLTFFYWACIKITTNEATWEQVSSTIGCKQSFTTLWRSMVLEDFGGEFPFFWKSQRNFICCLINRMDDCMGH